MTRRVLPLLSLSVFLRVAGVSLLLPGFVHYGESLGGTTGQAGLAFGAYPLALAVFILPLSALSDRIGRKPVMVGGLVLSGVGAMLAAAAPTIWLLMAGRFVQGSGAINGVALAFAGEVGDPDKRARRMAILGASAGGGFAIGMIIGALLNPLIGVPGLLLGHGGATLLVAALMARARPHGHAAPHEDRLHAGPLGWRVWVLALVGTGLNFSLTGLLFLSPLLVAKAAPGLPYAWALIIMVIPGGFGMFVTSRLADAGHARAVGLGAGALFAVGPLAFLAPVGAPLLLAAGVVFFIGHSALTALVPALVSTFAPAARRGLAQGTQSAFQYAGSAAGSAAFSALYPRAAPMAALFLLAGVGLALGTAWVSERRVLVGRKARLAAD